MVVGGTSSVLLLVTEGTSRHEIGPLVTARHSQRICPTIVMCHEMLGDMQGKSRRIMTRPSTGVRLWYAAPT